MTDKTEEQIARERNAVEAMKNAKSNMGAALDRIQTLEFALSNAAKAMARFKGYTPAGAYTYGGQKTIHADIDECIEAARKPLA